MLRLVGPLVVDPSAPGPCTADSLVLVPFVGKPHRAADLQQLINLLVAYLLRPSKLLGPFEQAAEQSFRVASLVTTSQDYAVRR